MATKDVPDLDVIVDENDLETGVDKIVAVLRQSWNKGEIIIKSTSAGYSNKNYHVRHPDHTDDIIVRLVNPKINKLQDITIKGMKYLKRHGIGAQLLCTFTNGIVMDFIHGETVSWQTFHKVKRPGVWTAFAREIAKYHAHTHWEDMKELEMTDFRDKTHLIDQLEDLVNSGKIPKEEMKDLPNPQKMRELIEAVNDKLDSLNAEIAFSHLDPNPTNVLITSDNSVVLLDYDYCYPHYVAFCVGYCFETCFNIIDVNFDDMPGPEIMEEFVREYLQERKKLDPERPEVTERSVQYLLFLTRKARLLAMLNIVVGAIIVQDVSHQSLSLKLSHQFWNRYLQHKHALDEVFE